MKQASVKKLRFLIFGLRNLAIRQSRTNPKEGESDFSSHEFREFTKLIHFAQAQRIQPVVFANHEWRFTSKDGTERSARKVLTPLWGNVTWLSAEHDDLPYKPRADAMEAVLGKLGCEPNEVLYLGNTKDDMITAVNGGVLFLNGTWYGENIEYGFRFDQPKEIAKFIDIFCLRSHGWHFAIEEGRLRYYSLAPFSTFKERYKAYSEDARSTAKQGIGEAEFWGRYLCATMFLTGMYKDVNYVCPFPSSKAKTWNEPLKDSLVTFAQCFRKPYIPDLIVRHTQSLKAQHHPGDMTHQHHLDTIHLTRKPIKSVTTNARYVKSPLKPGKTVMVVDDICTQGFSMEAARTYIEATGASVILVSWLKTINRPFQQIVKTNGFEFDPYAKTDWSDAKLATKTHSFAGAMSDDEAYKELSDKFDGYKDWDWP